MKFTRAHLGHNLSTSNRASGAAWLGSGSSWRGTPSDLLAVCCSRGSHPVQTDAGAQTTCTYTLHSFQPRPHLLVVGIGGVSDLVTSLITLSLEVVEGTPARVGWAEERSDCREDTQHVCRVTYCIS